MVEVVRGFKFRGRIVAQLNLLLDYIDWHLLVQPWPEDWQGGRIVGLGLQNWIGPEVLYFVRGRRVFTVWIRAQGYRYLQLNWLVHIRLRFDDELRGNILSIKSPNRVNKHKREVILTKTSYVMLIRWHP